MHTGIVLKRCQKMGNKVSVLDQSLGCIDGIMFSSSINLGSLLTYRLKGRMSPYLIDQCEIIDMPFSIARADLLFLHHVLELCYYFIPVGSCSSQVFYLLLLLYSLQDHVWNDTTKKIFLFKLLTTIGFYPEHELLNRPCMRQFFTMPIDKIIVEPIDLNCEKDLNDWLRFCVSDHPYANDFKTMDFLMRVS